MRQALEDASIDYITVYPEISAKEAWLERMKGRGNTEDFITFQNSHWDEFVNGIENESHGKDIIRLKNESSVLCQHPKVRLQPVPVSQSPLIPIILRQRIAEVQVNTCDFAVRKPI